jgi:hypothetical protein
VILKAVVSLFWYHVLATVKRGRSRTDEMQCAWSSTGPRRQGASKAQGLACVWIGLKCVKGYSASQALLRSTVTGSGCRSSRSVGGWNFSGRTRLWNVTGTAVSEPSQRSETTRMKYSEGDGVVDDAVARRVLHLEVKELLVQDELAVLVLDLRRPSLRQTSSDI